MIDGKNARGLVSMRFRGFGTRKLLPGLQKSKWEKCQEGGMCFLGIDFGGHKLTRLNVDHRGSRNVRITIVCHDYKDFSVVKSGWLDEGALSTLVYDAHLLSDYSSARFVKFAGEDLNPQCKEGMLLYEVTIEEITQS